MIYHALGATHFRNLAEVTLCPHPRFNVLHGDNGQGKTNLLEAIYLLATLRSFRTSRTEELIGFTQGAAALRARVEQRLVTRLLGLQLLTRPTRKVALVDGKAARSTEYFGGVNVVLFAPEDLRLPKGPPVGRRRFLDRAIWNTYPAYLDEVRTYDRVLRSRNALLRTGARGQPGDAEADDPRAAIAASQGPAAMLTSDELLDIYDQKLAEAGAVLLQRRRHYLGELAPQVATTFAAVCRTGLDVDIRYVAGVASARQAAAQSPDTDLGGMLREQLQRDRRRDQLRGYTHSGPHADDLAFDLDGRAADIHASQGQLRALVLALKIAEIQHLYRLLQDPPVLLLDDVSSELDPQRNAFLFEFLRTMPCQVFITTTSPMHVQLNEDRFDFQVAGGQIISQTNGSASASGAPAVSLPSSQNNRQSERQVDSQSDYPSDPQIDHPTDQQTGSMLGLEASPPASPSPA